MYDKKKQKQRRSSIKIIQQNIKQMRDESKQYINKNQFHLPLIFMARPDLFGTIQTKNPNDQSSQIKSNLCYKLKKQSKSKNQKKKQDFSLCKSPFNKVYNVIQASQLNDQYLTQATKKQQLKYSIPRKNRVRINFIKKKSPQKNYKNYSFDTRKSLDNTKCISMNSQRVDFPQKDSHIRQNLSVQSKHLKFPISKIKSQILRQYLDSFKNIKSQQHFVKPLINSQQTLNPQKNQEEIFPQQVLIYRDKKKHKVKKDRRKTIQHNNEMQQIVKLQQQIMDTSMSKKVIKGKLTSQLINTSIQKKIIKARGDQSDDQYTPWVNLQYNDQCYIYGFS